eukprot:TRINITY_DN19902_c0_g1_i1.p1 TRINITY_DN19902_c0_g1~~TRINITY_DN19902_c0_g1_i1.p1  ORF type:complete len:296 (+),score=69.43 TRINITY_DN19902_c0_g1_i1:84-971(+)
MCIRDRYTCGAVLMSSSVLLTCMAVKETPLSDEHAALLPKTDPVTETIVACRQCPKPIARAWAVQFFQFFGFFCIFTFGTDYFGKFVYKGDSSAPEHSEAHDTYQDGIRAGNLAMAFQTFVSVLFNALVPTFIVKVGIKKLLLCSDLLFAGCMFILALQPTPDRWKTTAIFAVLGIPWATTTSVPWYIVGRACEGLPNAGMYNGVFNMSQCFPEMTISLVGLALFGVGGSDRTLFAVGGAGVLCAVGLLPFLVVPTEEEEGLEGLLDEVSRTQYSEITGSAPQSKTENEDPEKIC